MKQRPFTALLIVLAWPIVLVILLCVTEEMGFGVSRSALAAPVAASPTVPAAPTVTDVDPVSAYNDVGTPVAVTGTGFVSGATVLLGETALDEVGWVSGTRIDVTVPWGLAPGVYAMTVVNPDGQSGSLPSAFTVTQGIGVWTTGGPYGGRMFDMVIHPLTPTTVYGTGALETGVFATHDAADHWQMVLRDDWPTRLSIDIENPQVLYCGGDGDLLRSMDGGTTWISVRPTEYEAWRQYTPAANPISGGIVYVGARAPNEPGAGGGLHRSDDYGTTWVTCTQGLTDTHVMDIAFHPQDPDKMLVGTLTGNVFYSEDAGESWTWRACLDAHIERIYFSPFGSHQAWAATQNAFNGYTLSHYPYRSSDPQLTVWTPITISDLPAESGHAYPVYSLAFVSDTQTIWAAAYSGYTSTDGGTTWSQVGAGLGPSVAVFAIDPTNPQVVYAGDGVGIFKSTDGGATWTEKSEGFTGAVPTSLAASPSDPDTVYARTYELGLVRSTNGGHSWEVTGIWSGGGDFGRASLAVDPSTSTRVYFGGRSDAGPCVQISEDGGRTYHQVTVTLPVTYSDWGGDIRAVVPHSTIPGRILAGAGFHLSGSSSNPEEEQGGIYLSNDYGESWVFQGPVQPISRVHLLAYDAVDPNLIYAGTSSSGLWRSTDGGQSWQVASFDSGYGIASVAAHPHVARTVYVRTLRTDEPNPSGELWVSSDAGETWMQLTDVSTGVFLVFTPNQPTTLYTGCGWGLCRSTDGGQSWAQAPGIPRPSALGAASDGERLALYVGTAGGEASPATQADGWLRPTSGSGELMNGGVYRLTSILIDHTLCLPVVLQAHEQ